MVKTVSSQRIHTWGTSLPVQWLRLCASETHLDEMRSECMYCTQAHGPYEEEEFPHWAGQLAVTTQGVWWGRSVLLKTKQKDFWNKHQKGVIENTPIVILEQSIIYFSKEYLKVVKVLPDPFPRHTSWGNISTRLASRNKFLLRKNMLSNKIYCCYIIINTGPTCDW